MAAEMNRSEVRRLIEGHTAERRSLDEIDSKRIVAAAGIAVTMPERARTVDGATAVAERLGFPVVAKVFSPDVIHKSDVGGVALDLRTTDDVRAAWEKIRAGLAASRPDAKSDGVTIQRMAPPQGIELLIGAARDDSFGPLVTFGLGGIFVEILRDTVTRLAPLTQQDARTMIGELRAIAILSGVRGRAGADLSAVANAIADVSRLMIEFPEISAIDLNPVVVYQRGLLALDARIILRDPDSLNPKAADSRRSRRIENLRRALSPQTVVVIGDKRANHNFMWLRANADFNGKLYSVQIDPNEIPGIQELGVENHASLAEIPKPVDYAICATPRQVAPRILRDCIAAGVAGVSFFTSGFSETGEELGVRLENEIRALAIDAEIAIIGPNCMGLCNPPIGLLNYPGLEKNGGGDICFISQSGTRSIFACRPQRAD